MSIEVLAPGTLTSLQDKGRGGLAHLGVGRAGAFDLPALRIANALCGNPRGACALEVTLLGPTLRFGADAWIALTGAASSLRVEGVEQPAWSPVRVRAGGQVRVGAARSGCRAYLAVRGGLDVEAVLGSRSTDVNARLGPLEGRALRQGDVLPIKAAPPLPANGPAARAWRVDPRPWIDGNVPATLRLVAGSHFSRLSDASRAALFASPFKVGSDSNRVGLRLRGPRLEWDAPFEIASEGCVPGVLQLPPSGQPIAFGPECPVSGGYPRIGQIASVDLPRLAQLRPGDAVRFTPITLDAALQALRKREHALVRLESLIAARLSP